ncbi:YfmQ family protein [Neobacillus sp. LXY-4]|uniref:YfmQ family protein n=1 Tax=Neobacillus sp. LXY-4 TaxID=3379826 RepID=UPI003EE401C6
MTMGVLLSIVLLSLIKILMTCLPTGTVEWLLGKFEIHSKMNKDLVTITINGIPFDEEKKDTLVNFFNQAIFMEKYYIWPGTEQSYINPKYGGTPIIIDSKKGKRDVRLLVFIYSDRVDVVKQSNKKLVAYSLYSESLQNRSFQQCSGHLPEESLAN